MSTTFDLNAINSAIEAAANTEPDMNESQGKGGGTFVPPAAGGCIVTLIGYIEKGIHHIPASKVEPLKYPAKDEDQVDLIFEISGKGHEPKEIEGKLYPERITVTLKKSLNEKAWFYRIFKMFASAYPELGARHMAQFLGKHFISKIEHSVPKKEGDPIWANLKQKAAGYVFNAPCFTNPVDDVTTQIPAPSVYSAIRLFLWQQPSKDMWDSLYIEGMYEEKKDEKTGKVIYPARSKNVIQEKIKGAKNFVGSPIADILGSDELLTLPDTDIAALAGDAPSESAVDDAIAGIL